MYGIALHVGPELGADRSGRRLGTVRLTDELAQVGDGVVALQYRGHRRPGRHELDEFAVKRALLVDFVELSSFFLGELHLAQLADHEAIGFEAHQDIADGVLGHGVGFDDQQRALRTHGESPQ